MVINPGVCIGYVYLVENSMGCSFLFHILRCHFLNFRLMGFEVFSFSDFDSYV